jgi:hypothetical protein
VPIAKKLGAVDKPNATEALKVRLDAMTKAMGHQSAAIWLNRNPGASAADLLAFLAARAGEARDRAIEVEMPSNDMGFAEVARLVDRYMDYWEPLAAELDDHPSYVLAPQLTARLGGTDTAPED